MSEMEHGRENPDSPEARRANYETRKAEVEAAHARVTELEAAMHDRERAGETADQGHRALEFTEAQRALIDARRALSGVVKEMVENGEWDVESNQHAQWEARVFDTKK